MSKKENKNQENNLENVIENTFNHLQDIVDANTVVGKIIKVTDKNFLIPVSKISVGLFSGGGNMSKSKGENISAGSGTGFNIVPIGFVACTDFELKFLPVNTTNDLSKSLIDICFNLYDKYFKKGESDDETESQD